MITELATDKMWGVQNPALSNSKPESNPSATARLKTRDLIVIGAHCITGNHYSRSEQELEAEIVDRLGLKPSLLERRRNLWLIISPDIVLASIPSDEWPNNKERLTKINYIGSGIVAEVARQDNPKNPAEFVQQLWDNSAAETVLVEGSVNAARGTSPHGIATIYL